MSAIVGYAGWEIPEAGLEAMGKTLARRCPEEMKAVKTGKGGFLIGGRFCTLTEGKKRWHIAFSGKLLNRRVLRLALRELGHRFRTGEDGELALKAWLQWGKDSFLRLDGGFALAIWEEPEKRLILARDPMGLEPLYYRVCGGSILFASEMKAILAAPGVRAQLDEEGAAQLVLLGPGRIPGSGVFRDIRELEPGCWGIWDGGSFQQQRYWKLRDREHRESFPDTVDHVRQLVLKAIHKHTEGNFGTFLSGGLDSSLITAVCAGERKDRGETLHTFSVEYENNSRYFRPEHFLPEEDGSYIHEMVEAVGSCHHRTVLTPEDLARQLEQATLARDLPGMGDVDFSLMAFCREISPVVPAALSGECADEIFGGYPWYRDPELRDAEGFPWARNIRERSGLLAHKRADARDYGMDLYRKACQEADVLPGRCARERRLRELTSLNLSWFMQNLLERNDRMRGSLEIRVPFCDREIAEYLYGIPWEMKDWEGREKGLLRYSVRGLLPERVRLRKKSPYPKTFDPQYESLMTARLRRILSEDRPIWYLLDREEVRKMLLRESDLPWYGQLMRRPQVIAWLLQVDVWLEHYQVELCF